MVSGSRIVTGFDISWKATSVAISRKQQYKPHLSAKQQVYCCLLCQTSHSRAPQASPRADGIGL